jgi:filamentous hemagglutinin family protein
MKQWLFLILILPSFIGALPEGAEVVSGSAQITQPTPESLVIQAQDKTILHFKSFDIGVNEMAHFVQPKATSTVLARVKGSDPSKILGRLKADGKLFLINPHGIFFGPKSEVNVGSLIASTLDIEDADFKAGRYKFQLKDAAKHSQICNQGVLQAEGHIALLSPHIQNQGPIIARAGKVALVAGEVVTVDFTGDGRMSFAVEGGLETAIIEHLGKIVAQEGEIALHLKTADRLIKSVVNLDGFEPGEKLCYENGVVRIGRGGQVEATSLSVLVPESVVRIDAPLGSGKLGALTVTAQEIDQNAAVKTAGPLVYRGRIFLGGKVTTMNNSATFDGPVVRDHTDLASVNTGSQAGDIIFMSTVDADLPSRSLYLDAGSGNIECRAPIGQIGPLAELSTHSHEIFFHNIGDREVGVVQALHVKAKEAVHFKGTLYHAQRQSWDAKKHFYLASSEKSRFISDGTSCDFYSGTLHINHASLEIHTRGGELSYAAMSGIKGDDVILLTAGGRLSLGGVTGSIGYLRAEGGEIVLRDEIHAHRVHLRAQHGIQNSPGESYPIHVLADITLSSLGSIGLLEDPIKVRAPNGTIFVSAHGLVHIEGVSSESLLSILPSNQSSEVYFNGFQQYVYMEEVKEVEEAQVHPTAGLSSPKGTYIDATIVRPRNAHLYYHSK